MVRRTIMPMGPRASAGSRAFAWAGRRADGLDGFGHSFGHSSDARDELFAAQSLAIDTAKQQIGAGNANDGPHKGGWIFAHANHIVQAGACDRASDEAANGHDPNQQRKLELHTAAQVQLHRVAGLGPSSDYGSHKFGAALRWPHRHCTGCMFGAAVTGPTARGRHLGIGALNGDDDADTGHSWGRYYGAGAV